jgi:hypothetical protein
VFGNLVPNCGAEDGNPPTGWRYGFTLAPPGSGLSRDSITYRGGHHSLVVSSDQDDSYGPAHRAIISSGCFPVAPDSSLDMGAHIRVRASAPVTCRLYAFFSEAPDCSFGGTSSSVMQGATAHWQRIHARLVPDSSRIAARLTLSCATESTPFTLNIDDAYAVLTPPRIFRDGFELD